MDSKPNEEPMSLQDDRIDATSCDCVEEQSLDTITTSPRASEEIETEAPLRQDVCCLEHVRNHREDTDTQAASQSPSEDDESSNELTDNEDIVCHETPSEGASLKSVCSSYTLVKEQYVREETKSPEEQQGFNWLDHFFPKKQLDQLILNDEDVITHEESDWRIIRCLSITYFLGFISILGLIITLLVFIHSRTTPNVVMPDISNDNLFERSFPMPHLAFVLNDSTVLDVSLFPSKSPSRGKLIKLPKAKKYFGYSDSQGILYFIDSEMRKPITRFHKQLGMKGFQTISFDNYTLKEQKFDHGISIGSWFWLFFQSPAHHDSMKIYQNTMPESSETCVWSKTRQVAVPGPTLSERLRIDIHPGFCATSLNATHLVVIGYHYADDDEDHKYRRSAVIDFANQKWAQIPLLPKIQLTENDLTPRFQEATIAITKTGHVHVFVHLQFLHPDKGYVKLEKLLTFDLSSKSDWKVLFSRNYLQQGEQAIVTAMVTIRGIPVSVMADGSYTAHGHGNWGGFNSSSLQLGNDLEVSNAIPFYA